MKPTIKLTPTQIKLKKVIKPLVERILNEEGGDFDQTEIQLARKLGTKLASELDYDGTLVGLAFLAALTDSNFHEERAKLAPLLSKVLGAKYKTSG